MENRINNIIPTLLREIESDGENESRKVLLYYMRCSRQEKTVVNNVLMYLCGWTFPTILKMSGIRSMKAAIRL